LLPLQLMKVRPLRVDARVAGCGRFASIFSSTQSTV
jgi:hypothetical protein